MMSAKKALFILIVFINGCTETGPIEQALSSDNPKISRVMTNLPAHEVQILFSEVTRSPEGDVIFVNDEFQIRDDFYHYPASTVKLPVALLALEKLAEDDRLDRYTRFQIAGEATGSSVTNELIKILIVSDDQAYNRLFEYLGKDDINRRLDAMGLEARIAHRLSIPDSDVLTTRPITFSSSAGGPVVIGPIANREIEPLSLEGLFKGVAYFENGEKIDKPFDFSEKNYLPLRALHSVMQRLIFPEAFADSQRFHLSESDRRFVLNTMKKIPREAGFDAQEFPDGYAKFLILGDLQERITDRFEIYNKPGWAYGYLTDSAYVVDHKLNREFIISASIHVNANRTFNDDEYEYEEIGVPFLAELGRQLVGY